MVSSYVTKVVIRLFVVTAKSNVGARFLPDANHCLILDLILRLSLEGTSSEDSRAIFCQSQFLTTISSTSHDRRHVPKFCYLRPFPVARVSFNKSHFQDSSLSLSY